MTTARKDLVGKRRGMLVCTGRLPDRRYVYADCDCGVKGIIVPVNTFIGKGYGAVSCGCVRRNCAVFNKGMNKNNTTGVKGVSKDTDPHKRKRPYKAYITFHGKFYNLGNFKTLEEAAEARRQAEAKVRIAIQDYVDWGMVK